MATSSPQTIDYLFEDPNISGQNFALVSIVGPEWKQKCDVWGLKVRGVADTMDAAKRQVQKLMRIDNNYDIYIVEVGKFFPLCVDPLKLDNVEYQNEQLNALMKSYLENRTRAEEEWQARKNELVAAAVKEGQAKEEPKEHPVSVLTRIEGLNKQIADAQDALAKMMADKEASVLKYEQEYTAEERKDAEAELAKQRSEGSADTEGAHTNDKTIEKTIDKLKALDLAIEHAADAEAQSMRKDREALVADLAKNGADVNDFINSNFQGSDFDYLQNNNGIFQK